MLLFALVAVYIEFLTELGQLPMLSYQRLEGDVSLDLLREQRGLIQIFLSVYHVTFHA
jgi:hypothetical protein